MAKNILISGGTGLVGEALVDKLLAKGYQVGVLSRSKRNDAKGLRYFTWDIKQEKVDPEAIAFADIVVHLAGAGIADGRWSASRKKEILQSRTESTRVLFEAFKKADKQPELFLGASAIGYYGADTGTAWQFESSGPGNDFLAEVVSKWEKSSEAFEKWGSRVVKLRIGVVLSTKGGALAKLAAPIKLGAGAPLGSGKQYMSWIHIDDLADMFVFAIENQNLQGIFNAVSPEPVSNAALTKIAAEILKKPLFLPNVPAFALKLAFGEMAAVVLGGNKVSAEKIMDAGFTYHYPQAAPALKDLFDKEK